MVEKKQDGNPVPSTLAGASKGRSFKREGFALFSDQDTEDQDTEVPVGPEKLWQNPLSNKYGLKTKQI